MLTLTEGAIVEVRRRFSPQYGAQMVSRAIERRTRLNIRLSDEAQRRIAQQRTILASFEPGSTAHRTATEVLLLLLDSAHVMVEAHETLTAARSTSTPR